MAFCCLKNNIMLYVSISVLGRVKCEHFASSCDSVKNYSVLA